MEKEFIIQYPTTKTFLKFLSQKTQLNLNLKMIMKTINIKSTK